MVTRLLYVAFVFVIIATSQLYSQVQKITKHYRTAVSYNGTPVDLYMDIFWDENVFSAERCVGESYHEVIMFAHGGFFLGGDRREYQQHCITLAERGFVAVTIDYRLGGYDLNVCTQNNSENSTRAVYRALQDAHSAMVYLQRNLSRIVRGLTRTDKMYVGGYSAGAITSLNLAFLDQNEVDNDYPYLKRELGTIVEAGYQRIYPSIVVSTGGAINGNLDYIGNNSRSTFVLAFAGTADNVVPFDTGNFLNCSLNPVLYGTKAFTNYLDQTGFCSRSVVLPGGGHGSFMNSGSFSYVISEIQSFVNALRKSIWGCQGTVRFPISPNYIYLTGRECANYYGKIAVDNDDYSPKIESVGTISYTILNQNMESQPTLSLSLSGRTDVSVKMYSLDGSLVRTLAEGSLGSGNHEYVIPDLVSGMYMIRISGGEYIKYEKLIVP